MKILLCVSILSVLYAEQVFGLSSEIEACMFRGADGKVYDISPLISKSDMAYTWTQTVYSTPGNLLTNPNFSNPQTFTFQIQLCRNITKPIFPGACNVSAPAYMYDNSAKNCVSFGKIDLATFEANPFNDGVHLNYYFGDAVSHILRYKCKIYFVCDNTKTMDGPVFEHLKDNYDAHFRINTKYAC